MRLHFPWVIATLSLCSCVAVAADTLDEMVVTATRTEQPLSHIGDSMTVLESDVIRAAQKTVVSDLLATTPGIAVARNGGLGSTTSLFIRGAETDQTVVLIDGIKLNDPSSPGGGYNFADLIADENTRIEVLRGPQSTLWGSQAIGGVVNVVTPIPRGPFAGTASAEGGSHDTLSTRARVQAGGDHFAWSVGGNYLTTAGISAFDRALGGKEDDGYRNLGANLRAIYTFNEAFSAEVRSLWSRNRNDFDGFPPPNFNFADTREYGKTEEFVGYAGLNFALLDGRWTNRLGYAYTNIDRDNFDPDAVVKKTFDSFGRNKRIEYQGTIDLTKAYQVAFGFESERSELSTASPSEFDPHPIPLAKRVRIDGVFAQLQATPIEPLSVTLGLRHDDHDEFGGKTTGRAALAWTVAPHTILRTSYGEGFKAPTLYQLYSEFGNTTLQPEEAKGWDAGIEQRWLNDAFSVGATYFRRNTHNMINFVSCFGSADPRCTNQPFGFYDNVQRAKVDGVEVALSARLTEHLTFNSNYTRTNAENDSVGSANFGHDLPRRARDTANAEVSLQWPMALTTTVAAQYVGRSFDDAANSFVLDSYTLVDLRVSYAVSARLDVYGRVENAFDEKYETIRNYGALGRGGYVGVRTRF